MRRYMPLLALVIIMPASLAAQQNQDLSEGIRVRIDGKHVGAISDLARDTLVLQRATDGGSDSWSVAVADITRLEVSQGKKSNWKTGMWVGTVSGIAIGTLAGAAACEDSLFSKGECVAMTGAAGMLIGVPLGTLVGALIKTERWENVPMEVVRVSIVPQASGLTLGISVSY